ncbi:MAG: carbohydrate ABC transporter permease [Planctomycetota bacterium]
MRARDVVRGYAYLAPNFLGFLVFTAIPVIAVAVMAFYKGSFTTRLGSSGLEVDAQRCGLENFERLAADLRPGAPVDKVHLATLVVASAIFGAVWWVRKRWGEGAGTYERAASAVVLILLGLAIAVGFFGAFGDAAQKGGELLRASWNTLVLLLAVPLGMAGSLGLALLINRKIHGRVVFRTLLFLPSIASGIALFLVWRWIFNADFGLLNAVVGPVLEPIGKLFGLTSLSHRTDWLGTRELAKPALIVMSVWTAMGGTNMVLYLAGLQGVDPTLYEAAEIDGADGWSTFWHVTWPELRPTTFFILTTNLIGGFQIFDQVYIMTGGGPEGSTTTILYYIYANMYVFEGRLGYAAAISLYLFAIVFLVTLVNYFGSRGGARAVRS